MANLAQPEKTRVAADAPLLTVVDLSAFEIEFQVAETYAGDIKPGMAAEITLEGRSVPGTVTAISPEVRQNQVTGRVKFANGQPARPAPERARRGAHRARRARQRAEVRARLVHRRGDTRASTWCTASTPSRTPVSSAPPRSRDRGRCTASNAGDTVVISDTRDLNEAPEFAISN